jgi:hypothetical protein
VGTTTITASQAGNSNWNAAANVPQTLNVQARDTDGDGVTDSREIADGTNPNNASSFNPLSKSLVAYYPFNGNANDESGNRNHASVFGASLSLDRNKTINSAYYFNGTQDYIQLPSNQFMDGSGEVTVSAWYRFQGGQIGSIFSTGDERLDFDPFLMRIGPAGLEEFSVADTTLPRYLKITGSLDYQVGVWRH